MSDRRARVLELARGGLGAIVAQQSRINDLNVYPVPDGDTGDNLARTLAAIVESLEQPGSSDRAALAHQVSRAALMGARGNSGVILSQIVRGAAESLRSSDDLAAALRAASDAAYRGVGTPVEGTMLTAIRELAEEAEAGGDLVAILARGDASVASTPTLLAVLAEAGVVDAGAAGLVEILRGIVAVVTGAPMPQPHAAQLDVVRSIEGFHQELSQYRYCTVFVIEGDRLDPQALEGTFAPLGDSLLVVGDACAVKVHLHTDDPGQALSLGTAAGTVEGVEIANMHTQTIARDARLLHAVADVPHRSSSVVAVASGGGNRLLFESLGARVVEGGRTMNPSTAEILAAIDALPGEVLVLPNNSNVLMAARQAANEASREVVVVPTTTLQGGLRAAIAFDPSLGAGENAAVMSSVVEQLAVGAVTTAARPVRIEGLSIEKGQWLGIAEGEPVVGGERFDAVTLALVERMLVTPREVLTLLTGEEPQPLETVLSELAARHPDLEIEVHDGGQATYPLLLSAE